VDSRHLLSDPQSSSSAQSVHFCRTYPPTQAHRLHPAQRDWHVEALRRPDVGRRTPPGRGAHRRPGRARRSCKTVATCGIDIDRGPARRELRSASTRI